MFRNVLTRSAALAALAVGSAAYAGDVGQSAATSDAGGTSLLQPLHLDDATTAAAPASAPAGPTTLTPLMFALDPTSFGQWMEKNKLNITGFVEGGYFYDFNNPRLGTGPNGNAPTYIIFPGAYSNRPILDQLDLTFSKTVDTTKSWDWGFLFESGFGTDDAFIHSHGILDNAPVNDPQNQYDIIQANVSLLVPVGSGLTLTAGKFIGILSNEVINPTGNQFYTHSYNFFYGVPGTNTGITGSYTFAKAINGNDWTVTTGITRGWNQSTLDNNGDIDFIAQAKGSFTSKLAAIFNLEVGPENTHDNSDYWTAVESILSYTVSDQLTVTGDLLYVDAPGAAITSPGAAQWYGITGYAGYKWDPHFTPNFRAEWYRDQGGFSTGAQANYYEVTAGVDIHPFPNDNYLQFLQIRPEVRFDWADKPVFNFSHNGGTGDYNELTAAIDAIMQF
ncbi:MAG: porin [Planctomycetota bacterium]|nr:porin [Planctomycetota bacterium]